MRVVDTKGTIKHAHTHDRLMAAVENMEVRDQPSMRVLSEARDRLEEVGVEYEMLSAY